MCLTKQSRSKLVKLLLEFISLCRKAKLLLLPELVALIALCHTMLNTGNKVDDRGFIR